MFTIWLKMNKSLVSPLEASTRTGYIICNSQNKVKIQGFLFFKSVQISIEQKQNTQSSAGFLSLGSVILNRLDTHEANPPCKSVSHECRKFLECWKDGSVILL